MRYFRIYADERNQQPQFLDWYSKVKPGRNDTEIYEELGRQNYFKVQLNADTIFMDLIDHPCFMVSKEFANLIRIYNPQMQFKYTTLFDTKSRNTSLYQIPILPEIECLHEKSKLSRDKSEIQEAILKKEKIVEASIFRLGNVKGRYIAASLEFVESAYRREVMGMRIQEYVVE